MPVTVEMSKERKMVFIFLGSMTVSWLLDRGGRLRRDEPPGGSERRGLPPLLAGTRRGADRVSRGAPGLSHVPQG